MKYVYKIVAALGALATIPTLLFSKLFYFKMSSIALETLIALLQLFGNESAENIISQTGGKVPNAIAESLSFFDLFDTFSPFKNFNSSNSDLAEKLNILITPAIVFAVIAILLIICAITTAIIAIVTKNNRKVICSSVVGIGLSLMLHSAFESLAAPVLNGQVSIATLMGSVWGDLIGKFEVFTLTTNFWFIPAIFGAVILWTVLYNYTLPDKEKRERKLMLGEADEE